MRAIVQDRYGSPDVLEIRDVDEPAVADDEVLVRVRAASMHPDVWHVVRGVPRVLRLMGSGLRGPKVGIPGTDVAGLVEDVGADVTRFRRGDAVFGECVRGHQWKNGGAYAELVAVPEDALAPKPERLTFEEAAAVPTSGLIAHQCLRDQGRVEAGQRVLINGAAGGVGTFAVQLAKAYGAHVTGVDTTDKLDTLRSIGADEVVDHTRQDFTRSGERYDLIVDIPGNHPSSAIRRALTPEGTYVLVGHDLSGGRGERWIGGTLGRFLRLTLLSPFVSQRMSPRALPTDDPLGVLRRFVEEGAIRPVIDRTYPLAEVPDAIRYLETGRVQGKVVITV